MRLFLLSILLCCPGVVLAGNMDVKVTICNNNLNIFLIEIENSVRGPGRSAPRNCSLVTSIKGIRYPFSGVETSFYSQNPGNLADVFGDTQNNTNFNFSGMDYGRDINYKAYSVMCSSSSFIVIEQDVRGPGLSPSYLRFCRQSTPIYFKSSKVLQGVYTSDMGTEEYLESEFSDFIN